MKKSKAVLLSFNLLLSFFVLIIATSIVATDFDDNQYYRIAFELIDGLEMQEAYSKFTDSIGGGFEPGFFSLAYFFSGYLTFDSFIILINLFFLYSIYRTLQKFFPQNYLLIYPALLVSNNYIVPLLSDVHRLKLALLVFMAYLFVKKFRYV